MQTAVNSSRVFSTVNRGIYPRAERSLLAVLKSVMPVSCSIRLLEVLSSLGPLYVISVSDREYSLSSDDAVSYTHLDVYKRQV